MTFMLQPPQGFSGTVFRCGSFYTSAAFAIQLLRQKSMISIRDYFCNFHNHDDMIQGDPELPGETDLRESMKETTDANIGF
jgi:hypothetical protein